MMMTTPSFSVSFRDQLISSEFNIRSLAKYTLCLHCANTARQSLTTQY